MNNKTDRQLDVWGIYRDPQHIYDALRIILDHKSEITIDNPLILYKNCISKFTVDGVEVGRYMDTFIASREADIALLLSNARKEKIVEEKGSNGETFDLEAIATPDIIEAFLKRYDILYEIVDFKEKEKEVNDNAIPETWFAREDGVVIDALRESHQKGCDECTFYPNINSELSVGYYGSNGEYLEIWGSNFLGLIETDNNWTFITNEGYEKNLTGIDTIKVIDYLTDEENKPINMDCQIDEFGRPQELDRVLVQSMEGECPADTFMRYIRECVKDPNLISDKVFLSDESVKYFINSKIVDLIGGSKDGKQVSFYWKECEAAPALEVRLELDEANKQYKLKYIKENARGDYKGFEWNAETQNENGQIVQLYREEDKKSGVGFDLGDR